MSGLTYLDRGGRRLIDCQGCGQAAKVELHGTRLTARCFAGCDEGATLDGYDVGTLQAELAEHRRRDERASLSAAPFRLLSGDDLLTLPDPSWLIAGLVPAQGLAVLYGAPSSFKSFLALDWALCVASGLPWFGHEVSRRWVVYVAAEGVGLKQRYRAWLAARGLERVDDIRFLTEAVNLLDPGQVERAKHTLDHLPDTPGLVVVDTVARAIPGGKENTAEDIGSFIGAIDGLRNGGLALAVHHTRRGDDEERGHSSLRGAADFMALTRREGRSPRLELECAKMRDAPEWESLKLVAEPLADSLVLSLRREAAAARDDLHERVLAVVREHGPVSSNKVVDEVGVRRADVLETLRALESEGSIHKPNGAWEVVPATPEPPGNHPSAAIGEGGSRRGRDPLRGPPVGNHLPKPVPGTSVPAQDTESWRGVFKAPVACPACGGGRLLEDEDRAVRCAGCGELREVAA